MFVRENYIPRDASHEAIRQASRRAWKDRQALRDRLRDNLAQGIAKPDETGPEQQRRAREYDALNMEIVALNRVLARLHRQRQRAADSQLQTQPGA